eukprot:CAMPEP_0184648426 /NCGR_PEP_ID=MMETSP0308-20130426/5553_1 /TAXON_ID=38269 /ORGANISM="Gloeochaete witrockiana, Strain SAG 46.84" /LENGTH=142 /DNA_ID=CAMNT_0027080241 /DNA_START=1 /DNA_END=427 /DNA_ORIENTATION=-
MTSQPTSQQPALEEEDAALLKFGKDFDRARCLLNSEVSIILEHKQNSAKSPEEAETTNSPMFQKTFQYVQRFSRYKNQESTRAAREILMSKQFAEFQVASIGNLNPESSEEAKALIPSLADRDDDELQMVLNDLATFENFDI